MSITVGNAMSYGDYDPEHFILEELDNEAEYKAEEDGVATRWQILIEFVLEQADTVRFFAPVSKTMINPDGDPVSFRQALESWRSTEDTSNPNSGNTLEQRWQDFTTNTSNKPFQWDEQQWVPPEEIRSSLKDIPNDSERTLFYFHLTPEVKSFVRTCLQSYPTLSYWGDHNNLPEDPAFYCKEQLILWTISHESMVYRSATEDFPPA